MSMPRAAGEADPGRAVGEAAAFRAAGEPAVCELTPTHSHPLPLTPCARPQHAVRSQCPSPEPQARPTQAEPQARLTQADSKTLPLSLQKLCPVRVMDPIPTTTNHSGVSAGEALEFWGGMDPCSL